MDQLDAQAIVAIWSLGFSLMAVAPETATIYLGGIVFYLAPLAVIWLPRRMVTNVNGAKRSWKKHSQDVTQIADEDHYTIIDGRTSNGGENTRYLPKE